MIYFMQMHKNKYMIKILIPLLVKKIIDCQALYIIQNINKKIIYYNYYIKANII